jgi:dUTPase
MLFTFVPFLAVSADPVAEELDLSALEDYYLITGHTYKISSGNTVVVPATATLQVVNGCTLTVEQGATLVLNGGLAVHPGGEFYLKGSVTNPENITGNGKKVARFVFPALTTYGLDGKVNVSYACSYSGSLYDGSEIDTLSFTPVPDEGGEVWLPIPQYVYILAHIIEATDEDRYDDKLINVYANGVEVKYEKGYHVTKVTYAGNITYNSWTTDVDFYRTCRIDLPYNKEGYTVYGLNGEASATGETVYIKYGKPFSFRVDIDEAYNKSPYKVYAVGGYGWTNMDTSTILNDVAPLEPDQYGVYTIPVVDGDYTVFVMGVIANETVEKVGGIFEQVKSIFEMIRKFFAQFLALFGIKA